VYFIYTIDFVHFNGQNWGSSNHLVTNILLKHNILCGEQSYSLTEIPSITNCHFFEIDKLLFYMYFI